MWLPNLVTAIASPHRNHRKLREDDPTSNSSRNLLRAFHSQPHVSVTISDNDKGLEPSPLTSSGLFLDMHDFHDLVFQRSTDEEVYDLVLLDGERVEI